MQVRGHSPCEFMHNLYIAELYRPEAICLPLTVWVCLHSLLQPALKMLYIVKLLRNGHSRPFKLIEIGINRKPICDFLLVFHCNLIPIVYRFRYVTI